MKKSAFFLLFILLILPTRLALAQNAEVYTRQPTNPGFFIPQQELQPRYERLPQIRTPQPALPSAIRPEMKRKQQVQAVPQPRTQRYIAVDGRYIPVIEKQNTTASKNEAVIRTDFTEEETPQIEENITAQDFMPVENPNIPEEQPQTNISEPTEEIPEQQSLPQQANKLPARPVPPQTAAVNPDLPNYRNRYNHYLADLEIFRQTGEMPVNEDLENTLDKLNSNTPIVLYPPQAQ